MLEAQFNRLLSLDVRKSKLKAKTGAFHASENEMRDRFATDGEGS